MEMFFVKVARHCISLCSDATVKCLDLSVNIISWKLLKYIVIFIIIKKCRILLVIIKYRTVSVLQCIDIASQKYIPDISRIISKYTKIFRIIKTREVYIVLILKRIN